jgi:hypothetical protein
LTLSDREQIFYWHINADLIDIQQNCMYTSLLFYWLFLIDVILLIVEAPNMVSYLEKMCIVKYTYFGLFLFFIYMSKTMIDGCLLEILKTHSKMMNGCINLCVKFWNNEVSGIEIQKRNMWLWCFFFLIFGQYATGKFHSRKNTNSTSAL